MPPDVYAHGARVTLVHREPQLHHHVKYWIKPDLENRIKAGEIEAYFNSYVQEIGIDHVVVVTPRGPIRLKNDFVLALIGYHPDYDFLRSMFDVVGRTVVVDEKHMDAVTALSASGPAYIYIILESLAEAGVKVGLPRDIATLLAAQTTLGAAKVVLETGDHPALLKDAVTTPAGCTIDAIMELEEGKLRVTLIKAVVKAAQRAKELAFG